MDRVDRVDRVDAAAPASAARVALGQVGGGPVGRSPAEGIAIHQAKNIALVANPGSDNVSVIDLTTLTESVGPYEQGSTWAEPSLDHAAELIRQRGQGRNSTILKRRPSPARTWLGGTHLSRFRARALPWLLCRRGFAASMPWRRFRLPWRRLCVVNVKLTMRFACADPLLW